MNRLFPLMLALILLCTGCGSQAAPPAVSSDDSLPPADTSAVEPDSSADGDDGLIDTYSLDKSFTCDGRELTVRLFGSVDRSSGFERCGVHTLEILEGESLLQTLSVKDAIDALYAAGGEENTFGQDRTDSVTADSGLTIEDLNFDGCPDIRLAWYTGTVNVSWICWLWDGEGFVYGFNPVGYDLTADGEAQQIVTRLRHAFGQYGYHYYTCDAQGIPRLTKTVLEDYAAEGATETDPIITVHQLMNGQWVQTVPALPEAAPEFTFADLADLEFYFSSGAGAWRTVLHIYGDGTFDGQFSDSDMGDADPVEFPNGTVYYSDFSGSFTAPEKVDDHTWSFQIESLEYTHEFGEEIKDGFRYVYSDAYGLRGAEELRLYLPGTELAALPEAYLYWVGYHDLTQTEETVLPFYGLYNVTEENGFSSYAAATLKEEFLAELAAAEETAAQLELQVQSPDATQTDMNMISGELFRLWDELLNREWAVLKELLPPEAMKNLTEKQLDWIAAKEAAVEKAGAEVAGGSMYPLVVNQAAADLTRERVYALSAYLR